MQNQQTKRPRLRKDIVKSYLTVCKLLDLEEKYPTARTKIDIENAKFIYMMLVTVRQCLNALLQDVGAAIENYSEKHGEVDEAYLRLIKEQN